MEKAVGVDRRRGLPPFPKHPLTSVARPSNPRARVALFADVFTNYGEQAKPLAVIRVLQAVGVDVIVTRSVPDGRAALSQGLIATARLHAKRTAAVLKEQLNQGRDIVVIEPSALAMLRRDYRHLLEDPELITLLRERSFEPLEYAWKVLSESRLDARDFFQAEKFAPGPRLFYHSHCQQKTIGAAPATEALLRAAGFDVVTSSVECCGMAGSFGYKKDYYDLSMAVGEDLFRQVSQAEQDGARTLVASGVSCLDQLRSGMRRRVLHPAEVLAATVA
jgi:Fe-S oxidoreductase